MSEDKLKDLLRSVGGRLLGDETLTEKRRVPSTTGSTTGSESSSVVVHRDTRKTLERMGQVPDIVEDLEEEEEAKKEQPLRIRTKNLTIDTSDALNVEEEDDFNDYVIDSPLPPPRDLQPGKLYALYEFSGDDPSHCELERDDSVVLLNDQDSYWWLVRKDEDGKIGFAPAECLETYQERLARLNCWKNEELERTSKEKLETFPEKTRSFTKINKSVAFSNEVTVTEPEVLSDTETDQAEEEDYDDGEDEEGVAHLKVADHEMETNSDVLSDTFPVTPLVLKKKEKPSVRDLFHTTVESDVEDSPFVQPQSFFANTNDSGTIGTYSPSTVSEFDSPGNTPPLSQFQRKKPHDYEAFSGEAADLDYDRRGNIPQSKGTRDIARSMKMLDDLINDELNTTATLDYDTADDDEEQEGDDDDRDITLTHDDSDEALNDRPMLEHNQSSGTLLASPIVLAEDDEEEEPHRGNLSNSTYTNSNISLNRTSTSTSVDQHDQEEHEEHEEEHKQETPQEKRLSGPLHPEIVSMFQESLTKMDELEERLKRLNSQFA